jgi:urease accessory protein
MFSDRSAPARRGTSRLAPASLPWRSILPVTPVLVLGLSALPAGAHHLMDIQGLPATPFNGLLSGLAHPLIGPDHLIFLLALCLLGLRQRMRWTLALLVVGLLGSCAGLVLPGLPGADLLVAATVAIEALVLLGALPSATLIPAMALHGYVLSSVVLGWSSMPLVSYMLGLLISQGLLLAASLGLLRGLASHLRAPARRSWAFLLLGLSIALGCAAQFAAS